MTLDEMFRDIGGDYDSVIHRFADNRNLLTRFIMKFPQDTTYGDLSEAVANYDLKEMEILAHTLKGLAGNLGFTDLFHACGEMVTAIRERTPDQGPDDFQLLFSNIQTPYEQIITCIKALDD